MKIYKFESFIDSRGVLSSFEFNSLPFEPKRIFLVYDVPMNYTRGNHAHYETKQLLVCINGRIDIILHDGKKETSFLIEKNEGVLVPNLVWDAQKFLEEDSKLLVFCSTNYDHSDYIFDFVFFKDYISKKNIT